MLAEEKNLVEEELENANQTETAENSSEANSGAVNNTGTDETDSNAELKAAHEKIAELQAKLDESENRIYRLQADFENSRRRARLDLEASEKYRAQKLITDLLPAIDNFERALQMESDNEQVKSVLQGIEMVYRGLLDALKNEGAVQIESVGKEFDPQIHHAVMQVQEDGIQSNTVVEEFQKGYMLKDRVIRPAMVKVNQ
jgi:molecular chaperone GrpE